MGTLGTSAYLLPAPTLITMRQPRLWTNPLRYKTGSARMQTQAESVQGGLNGIGRLFDMLRQTAQRAADAAVGAVRAQATEVLDTYRAELRRTVSVYLL